MLVGIHGACSKNFVLRPTGVERYRGKLLEEFPRLPLFKKHRFRLYLNEAAFEDFKNKKKLAAYEKKVLRAPFLWTQTRLSLEMLLSAPDVLFVPAHSLPRVLPKRSVVTIHGLEFEHVPDFYGASDLRRLRLITKDSVSRSSVIIAVSESTKNDLMKFYKVPEEKITVVPHGPFLNEFKDSVEQENFSISPPYFLYVGRLEIKKNVQGIIEAFERFRLSSVSFTPKLVLAGPYGFGFELIKNKIKGSKLASDIKILGYVPDDKKWRLLKNAEALVFPSFAEGFGFPILEAQAVGIPVITSNLTSMPEVAGKNSALFVDPREPENIAEAMLKLSNNENLRQNIIAEGFENLKRFSWEKTAGKTLDVILGNS